MFIAPLTAPLTIRMTDRDNVAIVANDGGLPAGTALPGGLVLVDKVPQGHKVALLDIAADAPVLRYGIAIGHALKDIAAGSWVHERLLKMPDARSLEGLPIATVKPDPMPSLEGWYPRDGVAARGSALPLRTRPREGIDCRYSSTASRHAPRQNPSARAFGDRPTTGRPDRKSVV